MVKTRGRDGNRDKAAFLAFTVPDIVRRSDNQGFELVPRRRVIERSIGRTIRWRRLVQDRAARIAVPWP